MFRRFFTMMFRKFFSWAILSSCLTVLSSWLAGAGAAGADVFQMGGVRDLATGTWTGLASVEFVPVGDAGNAKDPDTGYGEVDYAYDIGKYDVTAGQYCEFLNAVAKNADPYGLYNTNMNVTTNDLGCNIVRSISVGKYIYSVTSDWANRPVNFVSWGDAARFCNWLQNGQKTGDEDNSTTETGAYTLNGANTDAALIQVTRNANAQYFFPSLNEWYKAAYFDPNKNGSGQPGYWLTPLRHDTLPTNILDPTGTNNANFFDELGTGNHSYTIGSPYWRTEVGAFAFSSSAYGIFDQGGNVANLIETLKNSTHIRFFGTDFADGSSGMSKWAANGIFPTSSDNTIGFRIATITVPEPHLITLLSMGGITGILWRRRGGK